MSRWEGALAAAGFRPDDVDDTAAWRVDDATDPLAELLEDVVRTNGWVAAAATLDDLVPASIDDTGVLLDAGASAALARDAAGEGADGLDDDLTRPGRAGSEAPATAGLDAPASDTDSSDATATADAGAAGPVVDELTMTADVVGLEADPDAFGLVLDHLVDVEPPAHDAWHEARPAAHDDADDLDIDPVDDDLDGPGDWHLPG